MRLIPILSALVLILLFASFAMAQDIPSLVGTWEGECTGHSAKTGFIKSSSQKWVIKEQKGPVCWGVKTFYTPLHGEDASENFSATVNTGGVIRIAEHKDGLAVGTVQGDQMEVQYIEDGPKALSVYCIMKRK